MKVLFLRSNAVSPDPRVEKQALALCEKGYKVSILGWNRASYTTSKDVLKLGSYKLPIIRAGIRSDFGSGLKNLIPLFLFQVFLLRTLFKERNNYTVIHAADFDTVLPAMFMRYFFKKKVIYDIYDFYVDAFSVPSLLKGLIRRLDFKVINTADAVIITNESRYDQIKGSKPKKIYCIHNSPAEDSSVLTLEKNSSFELTVSYVGILQESRLLNEIIEVFIESPRWNLKIAGFGLLEGYIKKIAEKYSNIEFYGKVSYSEGLKISNQADVLFATYDPSIPNHKYTSPNKLYEAMMLSKPIIVCKNTGIDALVSENNIGVVIEYSKQSFKNAMLYFGEMKASDYLAMSAEARKLYDTKYSWGKMKEKLVDIYTALEDVNN